MYSGHSFRSLVNVVRYKIARRQLEGQFSPKSKKAVLSANDR